LRAICHTSQQPFSALYAATRGYITIKQLNKRSAFLETAAEPVYLSRVFVGLGFHHVLVAAWLIDKNRTARDNRAMMKSEGM
jgi:hypothetical protein